MSQIVKYIASFVIVFAGFYVGIFCFDNPQPPYVRNILSLAVDILVFGYAYHKIQKTI